MERFLSRSLLRFTSSSASCRSLAPQPWICRSCRVRPFTNSTTLRIQEKKPFETLTATDNSYSQPASEVSQNEAPEERSHFERIERESRDKQKRSPWMRQGSDTPPVQKKRSAGAMTKGKLLTTPSRMLKLILPLTTRDANHDRKDIEPLALLVHPQQPLSYLERLIQSELPVIEVDGKERIPKITFLAQDSTDEDVMTGTPSDENVDASDEHLEHADKTNIGGKVAKTGKISSSKEEQLPAHGHEEKEAEDFEPEDPTHPDFVRWSPSTEIGDFIRDAARAKEFAVVIEGAPPIYVGVPSFGDRTYYLRMRLRKASRRILELADIKKECDKLAQRGAQRVAQAGFVGLVGWWGAVYYLTFKTSYGWDVMEPVTYLVGLSGLMGGYIWFLYHNREVSYRSAMNLTVSRRQSQLYEQKGFNPRVWEGLVEEANKLRREIKMIAEEYDVEWDEMRDEGDEKVAEALR